MIPEVVATYRKVILENLDIQPESNKNTFRLMYGRNDGKRSVKDSLAMSILDVIEEIPEANLDMAAVQVKRGAEVVIGNRLNSSNS